MEIVEKIDPKSEIKFIHLPKTGGATVDKVLKRSKAFLNLGPCFQVTATRKYFEQKDPLNVFVFAVVRNPFDWLVSYHYHNLWGEKGWKGINTDHGLGTFPKFVDAWCDETFKNWHWQHRRGAFRGADNLKYSEIAPLFDHTGRPVVDFVIRYEKLDEALKILCDKLNIFYEPTKENVNGERDRDYRKHFRPDRLRQAVEKKCGTELELLGYDFENGCLGDDIFIDMRSKFFDWNSRLVSSLQQQT